MTMLESTVTLLEMLPEDDLAIVHGMAKRLLERPVAGHPYNPMTEEEWALKLDHSIDQSVKGDGRDAHKISKELREKYTQIGEAV